MKSESGQLAKLAGMLLLVSLVISAAGCTALVIGSGGGNSYPAATRSEAARAADEKISAAVRSEFEADRILEGVEIKVSTMDGIVMLEGSVADYSVRSQAETLAAGITGVRGINNRIKISSGI